MRFDIKFGGNAECGCVNEAKFCTWCWANIVPDCGDDINWDCATAKLVVLWIGLAADCGINVKPGMWLTEAAAAADACCWWCANKFCCAIKWAWACCWANKAAFAFIDNWFGNWYGGGLANRGFAAAIFAGKYWFGINGFSVVTVCCGCCCWACNIPCESNGDFRCWFGVTPPFSTRFISSPEHCMSRKKIEKEKKNRKRYTVRVGQCCLFKFLFSGRYLSAACKTSVT